MHPRNIDNEQLRNIGNEVEQRIPKNTAKKTTTKNGPRSLAINGNGVAHKVVVASSLASEDEDPRDIVEKLTGEFGLSRSQSRLVEDYLNNRGSGYVLEKAAIVRSQPRKNLGGAFEKALKDDWKAPKASEPPKRQKAQPAIPDLPLSGEAKRTEVAQMEARLETAETLWILADADQRSTWLERMDTVSRKLAPMNGSEPRRGFLLCLAAILESPPEMKSTLQSSELTAGRAIAA
jgi:hypothetical protein